MSVFIARCLAYLLLVSIPTALGYFLPKFAFALIDWREGILNWYPIFCAVVIVWKAFTHVTQNFDPYTFSDIKPFLNATLKLWAAVIVSQILALLLLGALLRHPLQSSLSNLLSPVVADLFSVIVTIGGSLLVAIFAYRRARESFFTGDFSEYRRHTQETRHVHRGVKRR